MTLQVERPYIRTLVITASLLYFAKNCPYFQKGIISVDIKSGMHCISVKIFATTKSNLETWCFGRSKNNPISRARRGHLSNHAVINVSAIEKRRAVSKFVTPYVVPFSILGAKYWEEEKLKSIATHPLKSSDTWWSNWILLRKLKYCMYCLRDHFVLLVQLSNSIHNISISRVKSSWTTQYFWVFIPLKV